MKWVMTSNVKMMTYFFNEEKIYEKASVIHVFQT